MSVAQLQPGIPIYSSKQDIFRYIKTVKVGPAWGQGPSAKIHLEAFDQCKRCDLHTAGVNRGYMHYTGLYALCRKYWHSLLLNMHKSFGQPFGSLILEFWHWLWPSFNYCRIFSFDSGIYLTILYAYYYW